MPLGHKNAGHRLVQEYIYDFSVDGGANGTAIPLETKAGYAPVPVGAVIMGVTARVVTAVVGTSSTVSWGHSANTDGYSGTTIAEASLTINSVHNGLKTANSDLWDDTNDVQVPWPVTTAALGTFHVLISTADLTAGKIVFMVEYLYPSV